MTITLEHIEAKQTELADLITRFKAQPAQQSRRLHMAGVVIELQPGEHYAGLALKADGTPSHHLLLLPGESEDLEWEEAKAWAIEAGGELPTRQEQALLYANLKAQFQPQWYWSRETHETNGSCAWYQDFYYGNQVSTRKGTTCRARAVRRFAA